VYRCIKQTQTEYKKPANALVYGFFLAKNANFDRNAPPWVWGCCPLGGVKSLKKHILNFY